MDGPIGQVLLHRPETGHALDRALLDELAFALEALDLGADLGEWAAAAALAEPLAHLEGRAARFRGR